MTQETQDLLVDRRLGRLHASMLAYVALYPDVPEVTAAHHEAAEWLWETIQDIQT